MSRAAEQHTIEPSQKQESKSHLSRVCIVKTMTLFQKIHTLNLYKTVIAKFHTCKNVGNKTTIDFRVHVNSMQKNVQRKVFRTAKAVHSFNLKSPHKGSEKLVPDPSSSIQPSYSLSVHQEGFVRIPLHRILQKSSKQHQTWTNFVCKITIRKPLENQLPTKTEFEFKGCSCKTGFIKNKYMQTIQQLQLLTHIKRETAKCKEETP